MDPQRHQRITEIFLQACELPEEERSGFLDEACAGDQALREAVEALLEHDKAVHTSMEQAEDAARSSAAAHGATSPFDPEAILRPTPDPERIGPYRILEKLGSGGMGVVYLAEQREPVRRRVALKVIRAGLGSREAVVRFEAERQALALMDHPNIAKVFDAGVAEDGRPYFVMEHIPGEPITRHCQRLALPLNERLDLFLQVCDAVQHAHQK
ncbi:MAG: serine/threonine protein kinase, partial [Planctomycetota bacterium]